MAAAWFLPGLLCSDPAAWPDLTVQLAELAFRARAAAGEPRADIALGLVQRVRMARALRALPVDAPTRRRRRRKNDPAEETPPFQTCGGW